MIAEIANLAIDGAPQDDLVPDVIEIEVQEDTTAADVFRVRLQLTVLPDGTWNYIDDERFSVWNRVSVEAGYPDDSAAIIDGYITHVDVSIGGDGDSHLEISGMDMSAMMDLDEKQLAWANKKDHEIAQEIFRTYGLSCDVEDTVFPSSDSIVTVMQAETDVRFLRRLAARNGFECYVRGGTGFFRSPNLQDPPQKLLATEFGGQTNLTSLSLRVDGSRVTDVALQRIDPMKKQVDNEQLSDSPLRRLGRQTLASLRSSVPAGGALAKHQPAASIAEMKARLRGAYQGANQFVAIDGEIDSRSYQHVLRAGKLVTVKGAGERFSGMYYVTRVRHHFTTDGYVQRFEGWRNALGLTGSEEFGESSLPEAVSSGVGGASVASGNRVLPLRQSSTTRPGG